MVHFVNIVTKGRYHMMTREEMMEGLNSLWIDEDHNQTEIARLIGISRITINRFMGHPERPFHLKTMMKIDRFLQGIKKNEAA